MYRRNKIKTLLIFLTAFIALVTAAGYLVARHYIGRVQEEIKLLVNSASNKLYTVSFEEITLNAIAGNITLQGVRLVPDMARYRQLAANKQAPNNVAYITVDRLKIEHVQLVKAWRAGNLQVGAVIMDKPEVQYAHREYAYNVHRGPKPAFEPYRLIKGLLKSVEINEIRLQDARLVYTDLRGIGPARRTSVENLNVQVNDLLLDSSSYYDPRRFYLAKDIRLRVHDYGLRVSDNYVLNVKNLEYRCSSRKLEGLGIQLSYSPERNAVRPATVYNMFLGGFNARGVNLLDFTRNRQILADTVAVRYGRLDIATDRRLQRLKAGRQHWPQAYFNRMGVPFFIKTLLGENLGIKYAALSAKTLQTGTVYFEQTAFKAENLGNVDSLCRNARQMRGYFKSRLYNQARLAINLYCNTTGNTSRFNLVARLDTFKLKPVTSMTRPSGKIGLKKGTINLLVATLKGDSTGIRGRVYANYNDLGITLYKQDTATGEFSRRGLLSAVANSITIRQNNPAADGSFKMGSVNYAYRDGQPFLGYVWRALFSGVRDAAGFSLRDEELLRQKLKWMHIKVPAAH